MKKLRLLGLFFGLALIGPNLGWSQCDTSGDDLCCDPDGGGFDAGLCFGAGAEIYSSGDFVSDIDCSQGITDTTCIPIDGGLSLLALAGGGLAAAAMRRRREEEEAAAQVAA